MAVSEMSREKYARPATLLGSLSLLVVGFCLPALPSAAQGISEYGGLMGMQRPVPTGHTSAVGNLYGAGGLGNITGQQGAGAGGLPVVGDSRVIAKNIADKANTFFNEAQKKEKAGKIAEAEVLYRSSAAWRERVWGTKDPAVYVIYGKIGALCTKQNKLPEAEAAYRRQIACAVRIYGAGAYEMSPTLLLIGENCVAQHKLPDAVTAYKQAYQLKKRKLGDTNGETLGVMLKLATVLKQSGNNAEADAMAKEGAKLAQAIPENALLVQAFNEVINPPPAGAPSADASAAPSGASSPQAPAGAGAAPQAGSGAPTGQPAATAAPGGASVSPAGTAPVAPTATSSEKGADKAEKSADAKKGN